VNSAISNKLLYYFLKLSTLTWYFWRGRYRPCITIFS